MGDTVKQENRGGSSNTNIGVQNIVQGTEEESLGIFDEIYAEMLQRRKQNRKSGDPFVRDSGELPTDLREKIRLNFDSKGYQRIDTDFKDTWELKSLAQEFIEKRIREDDVDIEDLISVVRSDFMTIVEATTSSARVQNPNNFERLSQNYLPDKRKRDPKYRKCALAMLHYLFEKCEFGCKEGQT